MDNINLTPFEAAANFTHSLAEGLCLSYAIQRYLPMMEELELQRLEAYRQGDYRLAADIKVIIDSAALGVSQSSFEA